MFDILCFTVYQIYLMSNLFYDSTSIIYVILKFLVGLVLFFYGLEKTSTALNRIFGNTIRKLLASDSQNKIKSVLAGFLMSFVVFSSNTINIVLVSFVQAGLMKLIQAIGFILGLGIGSILIIQLVSFKFTITAFFLIITGFSFRLFFSRDVFVQFGMAILNIGLVFLGIMLMDKALNNLCELENINLFFASIKHPLIAIFIALVFTTLIQSSLALVSLVLVFSMQALLSLETSIYMIIGANIGNSIIAFLASIGFSRKAKRIVLSQVIIYVLSGFFIIILLPYLILLIEFIGSYFNFSLTRNIANAYTIISILVLVLFFPFIKSVGLLVTKFIPKKADEKSTLPSTWHIDSDLVVMPIAALDTARVEIVRMAKILGRMMDASIIPFTQSEVPKDEIYPQLSIIQGLDMREDKLDYLEKEVVQYLMQIGQNGIDEKLMKEVIGLTSIVNDLESIGDIIHLNIVPLIAKKEFLKPEFSIDERDKMLELHQLISKRIHLIERAISNKDREKCTGLMLNELGGMKGVLNDNFIRIAEEDIETIRIGQIYMELIDLFKRMGVYVDNISKILIVST